MQTEILPPGRRQGNSIKVAKDSLLEAIENLDLSEEANKNLERSVLDIAILISFIYLELLLYERVIEGRDTRLTSKDAGMVHDRGEWSTLTKNATILKYLGMVGTLRDLQESYEWPDYLLT